MTPLTQDELLYEKALGYIGASPDGKDIESRKCRLFGNIGPEGQGFGPAFRTSIGLDADSSVPDSSKTVQAWAMWGHFVETKNGRQGDTVVTENFVGIVDSIGETEIRAIGFQGGAVKIASIPRAKSMLRRSTRDPLEVVVGVNPAPAIKGIDLDAVKKEIEEMNSQAIQQAPAAPPRLEDINLEEVKESIAAMGIKADGTPKKKPGRKPKALV